MFLLERTIIRSFAVLFKHLEKPFTGGIQWPIDQCFRTLIDLAASVKKNATVNVTKAKWFPAWLESQWRLWTDAVVCTIESIPHFSTSIKLSQTVFWDIGGTKFMEYRGSSLFHWRFLSFKKRNTRTGSFLAQRGYLLYYCLWCPSEE